MQGEEEEGGGEFEQDNCLAKKQPSNNNNKTVNHRVNFTIFETIEVFFFILFEDTIIKPPTPVLPASSFAFYEAPS